MLSTFLNSDAPAWLHSLELNAINKLWEHTLSCLLSQCWTTKKTSLDNEEWSFQCIQPHLCDYTSPKLLWLGHLSKRRWKVICTHVQEGRPTKCDWSVLPENVWKMERLTWPSYAAATCARLPTPFFAAHRDKMIHYANGVKLSPTRVNKHPQRSSTVQLWPAKLPEAFIYSLLDT